MCLVLGSVHAFSPRERVIGHFVLTVNKPKLYQSQPQDPTILRCSFIASVQSLSSVANRNLLRSFFGSLRSLFKVGPSSLSNFQSFPRVDPLLPRKELLLLSLYCLIQTASLFKNILGFLSKGGKNYKKNIIKKIIKNGTVMRKEKILCIQCQ